MQLTPQLAISCLLQSRFWYASSCLSTSFLNALQLTPQLAISCLLQSRFWYVSSYFLFYFAGPNGHSSISCASWTKVLFSTLPTEHPFSISHAFRTVCSLSLNFLSIAKVLSKRDSNPPKTNLSCYHCGRGTTSLKIS